jgi:hypothetical protein
MADIVVPDTIWTTLGFSDLENTLSQNNLYFHRASGGIDHTFCLAWAVTIRTWAIAHLMPLLSFQQRLTNIGAFNMSTDPYTTAFVVVFPFVAGSMDEELPLNCGFRLEFETGIAGRSFQGNNTVCGLPRSVVSLSQVDAGWADSLVAAYNELFGLAADAGMEWVVASRHTAGAPRSPGIATPITEVRYEDYTIDSWRQRLPNRHG